MDTPGGDRRQASPTLLGDEADLFRDYNPALVRIVQRRWWRDYEVEGPVFATVEEAMAAPHSAWRPRWHESLPPAGWWRDAKTYLRDTKNAIRPPPPSYSEDTFPIEIDADGLDVSLPPLEPGDRGELQFLVAWTTPRDEDNASTWFAVDWNPSDILRQAGCTQRPIAGSTRARRRCSGARLWTLRKSRSPEPGR
jgi:hypothetical protein